MPRAALHLASRAEFPSLLNHGERRWNQMTALAAGGHRGAGTAGLFSRGPGRLPRSLSSASYHFQRVTCFPILPSLPFTLFICNFKKSSTNLHTIKKTQTSSSMSFNKYISPGTRHPSQENGAFFIHSGKFPSCLLSSHLPHLEGSLGSGFHHVAEVSYRISYKWNRALYTLVSGFFHSA